MSAVTGGGGAGTCALVTMQQWMLQRLDLRDIRVISKPGGTVDDSQLVDGLVFDQKAAKAAGGPTRVEAARIALIQFCVSPPKPDLENNVVVSDYAQMDRWGGPCPRLWGCGLRSGWTPRWTDARLGGQMRWLEVGIRLVSLT
ncbi:T-complex protein 1 subunit delta [Haematococcus lacustris]|uniref:T-complex protein 1 subunit delta n=1 Tax=Haematococcus lacustris TaxID=44745 RepID=A0A699YHM6_HAELA|nr:T-complex protein 1 subunit delta [Haematococcus lacustris]